MKFGYLEEYFLKMNQVILCTFSRCSEHLTKGVLKGKDLRSRGECLSQGQLRSHIRTYTHLWLYGLLSRTCSREEKVPVQDRCSPHKIDGKEHWTRDRLAQINSNIQVFFIKTDILGYEIYDMCFSHICHFYNL